MKPRMVIVVLALLLVPGPAFAQTGARQGDFSRAWVDVNFGIANSAADEVTFAFPFTLFLEPALISATYPRPARGTAFDVGGGYMFMRNLGIGASIVAAVHENPVGLFARIPSPAFFNAFGQDTAETDVALRRAERSINIHVMFVAVRMGKMQVRVFGGPSFISYTADMVRDLSFTQSISGLSNTITITGFDAIEATGRATGFHVGGEFEYFFTQIVGVGGGVRLIRGTVKLDEEPMSEEPQNITVGGTQIFFGLRLRFGG